MATTLPDVGGIISQLAQGIQHIGNATTMVVIWAFSIFNITLPDTYARVIVLIISGWFLYKYGSKTADIVVFLVLALAAATLLGFQVPALP